MSDFTVPALTLDPDEGESRLGPTHVKRRREDGNGDSGRKVQRYDTLFMTPVSSIAAYAGPSEMKRDIENPYLRVELKRMLVAGVDYLDFASAFCPSLSTTEFPQPSPPAPNAPPTIQSVHNTLWGSPEFVELWTTYVTTASSRHVEAKLYAPFSKLINCAFEKMHAPLDYISCDDQSVPHEHKEVVGAKRKPDGAIVAYNGGARGKRKAKDIKWGDIIVPFEFKAPNRECTDDSMKRMKPDPGADGASGVSEMLQPAIHGLRLSSTQATEIHSSLNGGSIGALAADDSETLRARQNLPVFPTVPDSKVDPAKRVFVAAGPAKADNQHGPQKEAGKGDEPPKYLKDEEQLASYGLEILSAGMLRRHAIGVFIDDTDMQLWCLDRSGAIGSCIGHFDRFPAYFTVLVYLLSFAHPAALGYEPCLTNLGSDAAGSQHASRSESMTGGRSEFASTPDLANLAKTLYPSDIKGYHLHTQEKDESVLRNWVRNTRGIVGEGTNMWSVSLKNLPEPAQPLSFCATNCPHHQSHPTSQTGTSNALHTHLRLPPATPLASDSYKVSRLQRSGAPSPSNPRPSLPGPNSSESANRGLWLAVPGGRQAELDPTSSPTSFAARIPLPPSNAPSPRPLEVQHTPQPEDALFLAREATSLLAIPSGSSSISSPLFNTLGLSQQPAVTENVYGPFYQQSTQGPEARVPSTPTFDPQLPAMSVRSLPHGPRSSNRSKPSSGPQRESPRLLNVKRRRARKELSSASAVGARHPASFEASPLEVRSPQGNVHTLQVSWQPATRVPEDEFYRMAGAVGAVKSVQNDQEWNAVPQVIAHRCVTTLSREYRGVLNRRFIEHPRTRKRNTQTAMRAEQARREKLLSEHYEDRVLRFMIICAAWVPLCSVKDPRALLVALISLLDVHHRVYAEAGILHRAISLSSLCVRADNHSQGMLVGFEAARKPRADNDHDDPPSSLWRLAQIPFAALQLCRADGDPRQKQHVYRHDLEAFFWVLFWICCHYHDGVRMDASVLEWEGKAWSQLAFSKQTYLASRLGFEEVIPVFPPNLAPLKPCVLELQGVFVAAYSKSARVDDDAVLDKYITYQNIRDALIRGLEAL